MRLDLKSARKSIEALVEIETIKVWSLIATLFGDLSQSGFPTLSGVQIRTLFGHVGMKPEAVRVALHRLKNDGWIGTAKSGRTTEYSLSKFGIDETRAASGDIYRETIKYPSGWKLELLADDENSEMIDQINVFKNVVVTPKEASERSNGRMEFDFKKSEIPGWFVGRLVSPDMEATAARLSNIINGLGPDPSRYPPLDQAALRLLILHHWRKMALRNNTWFHIWLLSEGVISKCHQDVVSILGSLPKTDPNLLRPGAK